MGSNVITVVSERWSESQWERRREMRDPYFAFSTFPLPDGRERGQTPLIHPMMVGLSVWRTREVLAYGNFLHWIPRSVYFAPRHYQEVIILAIKSKRRTWRIPRSRRPWHLAFCSWTKLIFGNTEWKRRLPLRGTKQGLAMCLVSEAADTFVAYTGTVMAIC